MIRYIIFDNKILVFFIIFSKYLHDSQTPWKATGVAKGTKYLPNSCKSGSKTNSDVLGLFLLVPKHTNTTTPSSSSVDPGLKMTIFKII